MNMLLLHPSTRTQLEALTRSKPHAVILSGAQGSGKKTIALNVATSILQRQHLTSYPYFLQILPFKGSIGIEAIRQIKAFLSKKTVGKHVIRRIVLIGDAHAMTSEAQNALLKALEEPPVDTMLLLTTSDMNALKATIVSRAQHMAVIPVSKQLALDTLSEQGYSEQAIIAAYHMSGGRAGLLIALLDQKSDHEVANAITTAKEFLALSPYERLLQIDSLSKQKDQLELFIEGLQRVVTSGLEQAAYKDNTGQVKKFHTLSTHIQAAHDALRKNAAARLVLSDLFLRM